MLKQISKNSKSEYGVVCLILKKHFHTKLKLSSFYLDATRQIFDIFPEKILSEFQQFPKSSISVCQLAKYIDAKFQLSTL
jgi:hypothetical protein